jgi:hypothetical protein
VNDLLQAYVVDTQYPDVSGIEHLEMLKRRSELADLEHTLSYEESRQLAEADARLLTNAPGFLAELSRFIDLAAERHRLHIPSSHWWWYLDVLVQVPAMPIGEPKPELVVA